jgi:hypothetical protein
MYVGHLADRFWITTIVRILRMKLVFVCNTHTHFSSYAELAFCAILATFAKTANVGHSAIQAALLEMCDIDMKLCLQTMFGGHPKSNCMVYVESMQIPAQILHAQSCVF